MTEVDMNKIFNDDCLNILKQIPAETIDMVYLDPPFYTQRKHSLSLILANNASDFNEIG